MTVNNILLEVKTCLCLNNLQYIKCPKSYANRSYGMQQQCLHNEQVLACFNCLLPFINFLWIFLNNDMLFFIRICFSFWKLISLSFFLECSSWKICIAHFVYFEYIHWFKLCLGLSPFTVFKLCESGAPQGPKTNTPLILTFIKSQWEVLT